MAQRYKKNRKKQRFFPTSFYFNLIFFFEPDFTFRDSRQKLLTSCDPLHDVQPVRDDHSWWPFSHGSRACSRDGDCAAEMFFSLLLYLFICSNSTIWGAKVLISFELRKFYAKISVTFCFFSKKTLTLHPKTIKKKHF